LAEIVVAMTRHFPYILIVSLLLFILLFVFREVGFLDFWWWMSANLVLLVSSCIFSDATFRQELTNDLSVGVIRKVSLGALSAIILYLVFYAGNEIIRMLFDFASKDIGAVYGFKAGAGPWRIGLLMLLVIGPGEELLWRGYVQGNLTRKYGNLKGFILATILYTAIHVATGNLVLILAALTGGIFWGWMYMKYRSILMNSFSHVIWDIAVFLIFPFSS
jgi:uncharacterized protein